VRGWSWWRPVLAGAAIVTLAVTGWFTFRDPAQPAQNVQTPSEPPIATTPPRPVYYTPLEKPRVALSLSALTWRGAGDNQLLADLKSPLDAFRADDFARADREFAALETRYPQAIEVFFYGGVSRLFVNDPGRAAVALTRAGELADSTFAPRVDWYRAIADERAGRVAEARNRLSTLCRGESEHAREACRVVEQLDARTPDAR
jgi:hypothetical protein